MLYPADHAGINPARYDKSYLERQIAARVEGFGLPASSAFARGWRATLEAVQLTFVTWEQVLAGIGNDPLNQFYQYCRRFNRRTPASAADL